MQIPQNAPAGNAVPLVVTIGGINSNSAAVAVQHLLQESAMSQKRNPMMYADRLLRVFSLLALVPVALTAQVSRERDIPLKPWAAPLYWQPSQPDSHAAASQPGATVSFSAQPAAVSLVFVAMTPCRVADTRSGMGFTGAFGPPSLTGGAIRTFPIQSGSACAIPPIAQAYSLNVTALPPGILGFITVFPTGQAFPNASTLNDLLGTIVANAVIVPAGSGGSVDVYASDPTDLIIDINGYYAPQDALTTAAGNTNTLLGASALAADTTGINNTAAGASALSSNTAGSQNTATGGVALSSNTTGANNTATGYGALRDNATGSQNTAIGNGALSFNTTGSYNAAVGDSALQSNTTGSQNTASGTFALYSNTAGNYNFAGGFYALYTNTTGSYNTASGYGALQYNSTGSGNTAGGSGTLVNNTTGAGNTASGETALGSNTTGSSNTASGVNALFNNTSGSYNIGFGWYAGQNLANGSYNIMLGSQGLAADDHVIRIGDVQTQTFIAGISGANVSGVPVVVSSSGQLGIASSSRRFKEDIQDMGGATGGLLRLRPVTFRYKKPFEDGSKPIQYGLIAEEVAEVYPELVAHSADGRIETVKYQVLDSMLLNEVQRLHAQNTAQQEKIQSLEERLSRLESLLEPTSTRTALR